MALTKQNSKVRYKIDMRKECTSPILNRYLDYAKEELGVREFSREELVEALHNYTCLLVSRNRATDLIVNRFVYIVQP
ncbi:MAG: hypothetical protein ACWGQW_00560 [bacterium]